MAVKAIHLFVCDHQVGARLLLGKADRLDAGLGLIGDRAAELAGHHDQRPLQQPALGQVANQLGDRARRSAFSFRPAARWPSSCVSKPLNAPY